MKSEKYIILIILTILFFFNSYSQRAERGDKVIIVNSGIFEMSPPFLDYVTVQAYDPVTRIVSVFDTIYTQSAQDVVVDGHYAYIAAQDSIIKYDIDIHRRVAAIADSGMAKFFLDSNRLIVSKQWPITRYFVEILDTSLAHVTFIDGISGQCSGIAVDGDSVYVAVNNGWTGVDGRLAVISKKNWTLTREINYGTDAVGILNLYNYGGRIFSVNKTPYGYPATGSVTAYKIDKGSFKTNVLKYTVGDGVGIVDNLLYLKINEGIGSYNMETQALIDTAIFPDPGSSNQIYIISSGVDTVNNLLYLNIGNHLTNGFGLITNLAGDSLTSFSEGISADCMAVCYRKIDGLQPSGITTESFSFSPNPVENHLSVIFPGGNSWRRLMVSDVTGRTIYERQIQNGEKSVILDCETFPAGIYFLSAKTDNSATTKKFIKK